MDSKTYWETRGKTKERMGDKSIAVLKSECKRLYEISLKNIQKEIDAFYGRYAGMNGLSIADVQKRLNPDELKSAKIEIANYYNLVNKLAKDNKGKINVELLRKYKEELRLQSARAYMSRLEGLKNSLRYNLIDLGFRQEIKFNDELSKLYENIHSYTSFDIDKTLGFSAGYSAIPANKVEYLVNERWLGENYSDRIWKDKNKLLDNINNTFLQGIARGQNSVVIAREIAKNYGTSFYNAERLCITESAHITESATMESYKEHGVDEIQFVATLDAHTCPICGGMDNQRYARKEAMTGVNYPPMHPNCVLPDNIVFSPDAERMTRSYYSGDVIKVRTSKGGWFSVTPNHIMLTSRGWVRAKNLVKSDKVIRYVDWNKFVKNPTNDNCIPTIENLFTSFIKLPFVFTETMKSTSKDFKGDIVENTKIDIININSLLRNKINVPFVKFISDFKFVLTRKFGKRMFPRSSTMAKFLACIGFAFDGIMSIDSILSIFFRSSFTHHKLVGLRSSSDYNSRLNKSIVNNGSCDIKDFSKFVNACSSIIQFDDVIDIQISNFSGYVYDFSSTSTLYICNGYLSSNCRCTTIAYFEPDEIDEMLEESERIAREDGVGEWYEVPASMSYAQWINTVVK